MKQFEVGDKVFCRNWSFNKIGIIRAIDSRRCMYNVSLSHGRTTYWFGENQLQLYSDYILDRKLECLNEL